MTEIYYEKFLKEKVERKKFFSNSYIDKIDHQKLMINSIILPEFIIN